MKDGSNTPTTWADDASPHAFVYALPDWNAWTLHLGDYENRGMYRTKGGKLADCMYVTGTWTFSSFVVRR